jgi:uncharacterized protein YdeI (YjbR/CyaY-like superfamily)
MTDADIHYFETPAEWRRWLAANHAKATELYVGFRKKATGQPSITWPEAVDEALCCGWIDGVRKSLGSESYFIRFTPRKAGSIWSSINIARVEALTAEGRMRPSGLAAFSRRSEKKSRVYSFEQKEIVLAKEDEAEFRAHRDAWKFFAAQPASYRRAALWWIVNAKKDDTRARRLEKLIDHSERGLRLPQFTSPGRKSST